MGLYPENKPNHFRTKLAQSITLDGSWQVGLLEICIPGKFFTFHDGYNTAYTIKSRTVINEMTIRPEIIVDLYNSKYPNNFVQGVNANLLKIMPNPPLLLKLTKDQKKLSFHLDPGWNLEISAENAPMMLYSLFLAPNETRIIHGKLNEKFIANSDFREPNGSRKNQFFRLYQDSVNLIEHSIKVNNLNKNQIFTDLNTIIAQKVGDGQITFSLDGEHVIISITNRLNLQLEQNQCPKLMSLLNIKLPSIVIRGRQRFKYTPPENGLDGDIFKVNVNKVLQLARYKIKVDRLKINPGMYKSPMSSLPNFRL